MTPDWLERRGRVQALYDGYYHSRGYQRRFPRPNQGTLDFIERHGATRARLLGDIGCGSGRYALPLLSAGHGRMVGCDISPSAIAAFAERLRGSPHADRVQLLVGGVEALPLAPPFDCFLMLFGVLSQISPRAARIDTLRQLRLRAGDNARLLLSVPNRWRRRPLELVQSLFRRDRESFGDIEFKPVVGASAPTLSYHLYSTRELRQDLAAAGWELAAMEGESLAPEWLVTQRPWLDRLDRRLQRWLPAALGYGIRVAARAAAPAR